MKKLLLQGAAVIAMAAPIGAYAQSTGSVDFENDIIVTGATVKDGIKGVLIPDGSKSRAALTSEMIQKQRPGNTILDSINLLPGVNFQNNDPYGSAGGTLNIRGFSADRISLTQDGIPLNDTGNYAIYSNQQIDPELIENVTVSLGSTDVDSPTAAASGSTVNYRTRRPKDDFGGAMTGSVGDYSMFRVFGVVDTGVFTPWGTTAFIAASHTENNNVYNNRGVINKDQYNAKIYQPIGSNGDFLSVAGHYNQNRNNFTGSVPLRTDLIAGGTTTAATYGSARVVGPNTANRFPTTEAERFYTVARCQVRTATPGVFETAAQVAATGYVDPDGANTCGTTFDERYNPSNTGNIRINSRFTLAEGLVLTVDPSYQYTLANGGGTVTANEGRRDVNPTGGTANCTTVVAGAGVNCQVGYIGGVPYFGRDLNGDGDTLDTVTVLAPSTTQTRRFVVIAGLRYDIDQNNTVRVAYTFDHGRHRQTGEVGLLKQNGEPFDFFPRDNPQTDVTGAVLQKRDRLSYAVLHQVAGQYRGKFFDNVVNVDLGVRAPFFKRDLTNNCYTSSASGFVECFGTYPPSATYTTDNPTFSLPQQRVLKYNKVLPSGGVTVKVAPNAQVYGSYSKGLSVPSTDNLYNAFFFSANTAQAKPKPEVTDNFEAGVRYTTGTLQFQAAAWYTKYQNRLASSYDPDLNATVYRNLGTVKKKGIDGSIGWSPIKELNLYAFGSYLDSKIQDDVQIGIVTVAGVATPIFAPTKGKREAGASKFSFGGRAELNIGDLEIGLQVKRYGPRYIYDSNEAVYRMDFTPAVTVAGVVTPQKYTQVQIYGAKTPSYTLLDADMRYSLKSIGAPNVYLQLNISNLLDQLFVGGFTGNSNQSATRCSTVNVTTAAGAGTYCPTVGTVTSYGSAPNAQIGSPRAAMLTLHVEM